MPNDVTNNLEIICEDEKTMNKIRMMIFDVDENNNRIYTMEKMLPMPSRFSGLEGYNDYGYDWANAIWGTKWDVYNCIITDSGDTITIDYSTAWRPNLTWVELLRMYIEMATVVEGPEEASAFSIKLHYHDYMGNFGGYWEWEPNKKPSSKEYSIMEYARLHDKSLYEWLTEFTEMRYSEYHHVDKNDNESMTEFNTLYNKYVQPID